MNLVLIALFGAVASAFAVKNFTMTARAYRALPPDVPDHFNEYGDADAYGPRPMIFAMPLAALVILAFWATIMVLSGAATGMVCISGTVADFVVIAFFYMQRGIVNVASGKIERMHPYAFWKN